MADLNWRIIAEALIKGGAESRGPVGSPPNRMHHCRRAQPLDRHDIIDTEANRSATLRSGSVCGCDILTIFNCFQRENPCPPPLVILSEASRSHRDAKSKSLSRACRGNLPPGLHPSNRPPLFDHPLSQLYIRAW